MKTKTIFFQTTWFLTNHTLTTKQSGEPEYKKRAIIKTEHLFSSYILKNLLNKPPIRPYKTTDLVNEVFKLKPDKSGNVVLFPLFEIGDQNVKKTVSNFETLLNNNSLVPFLSTGRLRDYYDNCSVEINGANKTDNIFAFKTTFLMFLKDPKTQKLCLYLFAMLFLEFEFDINGNELKIGENIVKTLYFTTSKFGDIPFVYREKQSINTKRISYHLWISKFLMQTKFKIELSDNKTLTLYDTNLQDEYITIGTEITEYK
ncbi:hypothetical protein CDIK_2476 [Cucumispora dikerogammari]|nr:hypothetical protein CDIK_2476 [Cucumispora dikerogammari]